MTQANAFDALLDQRGLKLPPLSVETLQVNITKTCNQACRHCHVDASPARTESMSRAGIEKCLEILAAHPQITIGSVGVTWVTSPLPSGARSLRRVSPATAS